MLLSYVNFSSVNLIMLVEFDIMLFIHEICFVHMRSPVFCPSLGITNRNTVILVMLMMHDTIWMEGMLMGAELLLSLLKG
jgi:hypothetical protein